MRHTYGFGVAALVPSRPLRPLNGKFTRKFVSMQALPEAVRASAAGRTRRAVLVAEDGSASLETAWQDNRRILHCMIDCGSVGWPSKNWLFYSAECRGERWIDPPHRRSNNIADALGASRLLSFRAEALVLVNCSAGPWWGAANHQAWREAGTEWHDSVTSQDELFCALYPWIVHDWTGGVLPSDMFSDSHMEMTFRRLRDHLDDRGKGDIVRLNRWFQVWTKARGLQQNWSANLTINLVMAIQRGYYKGFEELALFRDSSGDTHIGAAPPVVAAKSAAKAPGRPVKSSNANVEALRMACQSTLHVATEILASRSSRAMIGGLCAIIAPIEKQHALDVTRLKTAMGRQAYNVSMASGESGQYIIETLAFFSDRPSLVCLGLEANDRNMSFTTMPVEVSNKVLQSLFDFWVALVALEISFQRIMCVTMPGMTFGLLHRDPDVQHNTLQKMRQYWEKLAILEPLATDDKWLEQALTDLSWPRNVWSRELLLGACEAEWVRLPEDLLSEVRDTSLVVSSSKAIEDIFNFCRYQTEGVRNNKQSEKQVWHAMRNSGVLEDNELLPVQISAADEVHAGHNLPKAMFKARAGQEDFSMGDSMRKRLFEDVRYPSFSIAKQMLTPTVTSAMVRSSSVSEWKRFFLSSLCIEGSILYSAGLGPDVCGLVIQSSSHGALLWEGEAQGIGGYRFFELRTEGIPWRQVCISREDEWKCMRVAMRCPEYVRSKHGLDVKDHPRLAGATLELMPGSNDCLLAFSAEQAFKSMTLLHLSQLWQHLDVPCSGARPTLLRDVCRGLLEHILGKVSDEDFDEWFRLLLSRYCAVSSQGGGKQ